MREHQRAEVERQWLAWLVAQTRVRRTILVVAQDWSTVRWWRDLLHQTLVDPQKGGAREVIQHLGVDRVTVKWPESECLVYFRSLGHGLDSIRGLHLDVLVLVAHGYCLSPQEWDTLRAAGGELVVV